MKQTILFADVHLRSASADDASHKDFLAFLHGINAEETDRLICLGDLFDFWFEYRHVVFSGYFEVLQAFASLKRAGVELHLICGNHDFWAGPFLENQIGFILHHDAVRLPFGESTALLLHGDGLNPRDYGYRLFKRLARNRFLVSIFRRLHPDTAMTIANAMSRGSRKMKTTHNHGKNAEAEAVRMYAHRLLQSGETPIVISGHVHVPIIDTVETRTGAGLYVNPGDWPLHRSYVVAKGRNFTLHTFCQTGIHQ